MELIQIRALSLIIEATPRGTVVLNPPKVRRDGTHVPGDEGGIPARRARELVDLGMAEYAGEPVDPAAAPPAAFTMTHQSFGRYLIEGPGVDPDTVIKGRADAETLVAELEKAHATTIEPRQLADGEMLAEGEGGPDGEPVDPAALEPVDPPPAA